jgi:hypothetical protein
MSFSHSIPWCGHWSCIVASLCGSYPCVRPLPAPPSASSPTVNPQSLFHTSPGSTQTSLASTFSYSHSATRHVMSRPCALYFRCCCSRLPSLWRVRLDVSLTTLAQQANGAARAYLARTLDASHTKRCVPTFRGHLRTPGYTGQTLVAFERVQCISLGRSTCGCS